MTQKNLGLIFPNLEARAIATATDAVHDRVFLADYVIETEIGAFNEERGTLQRLRFNVVIEVRSCENIDDDVDKILSYDTIIDAINHALSLGRINLLETLAENIASHILSFELSHRILIRIEKLDRGPYMLGVEIIRHQAPKLVQPINSSAKIVFLGREILQNPDAKIGRLIEGLKSPDGGVVLCIDAPSQAPDASSCEAGNAHDNPQLRLDLLQLEQAAWHLALQDKHLTIVHSQTELTMAINSKKTVIWAPSKAVIDTPQLYKSSFDPFYYCLWLAEKINAQNVTAFSPKRKCATSLEIIWRDYASDRDSPK